jgi:hypothetical protein
MSENINIISFPRSGQHLLQSILEYLYINHNLPYSFCEYYTCCETIPCKHNKIIQKNHDFGNRYAILSDAKYIVLYRNDIILQLESFYRFNVNKYKQTYSKESLVQFIKDTRPYYTAFINKWVNNTNPNILKVEYYTFLQNPVSMITTIFKFIHPSVKLNTSILYSITNKEFTIKNKDDSAYYNTSNKIQLLRTIDTTLYNEIKEKLNT